MEEILWVLLEIFGEGALEGIIEIFGEVLGHNTKNKTKKPPGMVRSVFVYMLIGFIIGGITVLIFPHSFVSPGGWRVAALFLSPLVAAFIAVLLAAYRHKQGQQLVGLNRFGYAYVFAFGISLARFTWAS